MNGDQDFDLTIPEPHATLTAGPARVGAELQGVRERLGWKLPDVAARLKIRRVFLEAIEAGNLAALPAPAYAAGFIRSYAEAMGLDPEEILRRFRAEGMSRPRQPQFSFPEPVPDRAVPPGAIVFLVAVIGIGAYFFWYRHSEHELKLAQMVPSVPARLAPLAVPKSPPPALVKSAATAGAGTGTSSDQPAPPPSAATADQVGANPAATNPTAAYTPDTTSPAASAPDTNITAAPSPGTTSPAASTPDTNITTASTPDTNITTAPSPGTSAPGTASPPTAAIANAGPASSSGGTSIPAAALVISASADSWIQVRGPQGNVLFSRVLKSGQTWPVPDEPGLTLTTGNAGGTELVRKGVTGQPLGNNGAVLHNIPLTPPAAANATGAAAGSSVQ